MTIRLLPAKAVAAILLALTACGAMNWPVSSSAASSSAAWTAPGVGAPGQTIVVPGVNVPAIAVDPRTHLVWAAVTTQGASDHVDEISEATGAVIRSYRVAAGVDAVAVDPAAGTVWAGSTGSAVVTEITEASGVTHAVDLSSVDPSGVQAIAADPAAGRVFVLTVADYLVSIAVPSAAWRVIGLVQTNNTAEMVVLAGTIWITETGEDVRGFSENGRENVVTSDPDAQAYYAITSDPITRTLWVADESLNRVSRLTAAGAIVSHPIGVGGAPVAIAADPATGTLWVANFSSGTLSEIREASAGVVGTISAGALTNPYSVAADPSNGRVYVGGFIDSSTGSFAGAITAFKPAAPAFTSPASAWFATGNAREDAITLTTAGFPLPAFTITSPSPPSWLRLNKVTGVLAGTPPSSALGSSVTLTITSSNSVGTAHQVLVLRVGADPVFTSAPSATFTAGTAGRFLVTARATPAATLSIASGSLPSGLRLSGQGVLSGVPAAGTGGRYRLVLAARNALHRTTRPFTLTVLQAPGISCACKVTARHGRRFSLTIGGSGFPVPALKIWGRLPSGLRMAISGGTAVISGVPARSAAGHTYKLTVTAANGVGSPARRTLMIAIT